MIDTNLSHGSLYQRKRCLSIKNIILIGFVETGGIYSLTLTPLGLSRLCLDIAWTLIGVLTPACLCGRTTLLRVLQTISDNE